ncbi:MAG TPA: hypothetical protein VM186_06550 [Planctomycetota bacterium]|nr:hypothetical protein [Planctomycetota bacterium]
MKTGLRDEQFCNVVLSFITAKNQFDDLLADYRKESKIGFTKLDRFVEDTLFTLKEDSHFLFRQANNAVSGEISPEMLFDISVGSIFHELMKIKENVYQLECYAPKYSAMAKSVGAEAPEFEKTFLEACHKIVRRARRTLPSDLAGAEELFRDTADNLALMLRGHTDNPLLARMLIDYEAKAKKCFDVKNIDALLSEIYAGKLDEARLAASRDYLEGGWYEKAKREAQKVLAVDPANAEAGQIIAKLSGKLVPER